MTVRIKSGDLLKENVDAIVNTVNCVGVMGKGIALQFKQRWPKNFKAYEAACKRKEVKPGKMFIYDLGEWAKPRFIINFPTKLHWRGDSKIEYVKAGLHDLVKEVQRLGIKSIALPPLGCGSGGLDWDLVKPLIISAFEKVPGIQVAVFEPAGAPPAQEMVNLTEKPAMTPARAAIVTVISIYREMEYGLSHIEIQKLAYFLEKAGQRLNLEFVKHNYGPYSDRLRHVLKALDGHYIVGVGDFSSEADISLKPGALAEASEFIRTKGGSELSEQVERVRSLIDGYETPYGMELLATVHWVVTQEPNIHTADEAVVAVHNWNPRKRAVMREDHIRTAWHRLNDRGWFRKVEQNGKDRLSFL
jgi:O-acetyl-ADP-ribose deacetylase (regulator of RNase III)